jgi:tetratricopeptide (TPR) repeat protein
MRQGVNDATKGGTIRLAAWVLVLGLSTGLPGRSLGQQPSDGGAGGAGPQAGGPQRVLPKHRELKLQNGGGAPARTAKPDIYRVTQAKGGWLLIRPDDGPPGWAAANDVVAIEQAVAFFSSAISKEPRDPYNFTMRALALLVEREDPQHALADCDEAVRLDPKDPIARRIRGAVHSAIQNHDKAMIDFDEVVKLRPNEAASYHDRGTARMYQREFDQAIADFTQAIRLNPKAAATYISRAAALLEKDQRDQAIADCTEALRLDPESAEAYVLRASIHGQKGEFDQAIADFSQIIKRDPQAFLAYEARGTAWRNKKDYARAVADFDEAIRLNPNYPGAYVARGFAWRDQHAYEKAVADIGQALRLDPENPELYAIRGDTWVEKKAYDRAISDYDRVIQLEPKHASAYCSRGLAHARLKHYDQAIADLDQALQLDPRNTDALNGRAWFLATCPVAKYRSGAQAVAAAKQACELAGGKDAGMLDTLAAAYAEAGDFDSAQQWQAKAIALETDAKEKAAYSTRLRLYQANKPYRDEKP